MKVRAMLCGLLLTVATALSSLALPASAATSAPVGAQTHPTVTVFKSQGVPGVKIANAIAHINTDYRDEITKKAVRVAAKKDGHAYNVIIVNLSLDYQENLKGVHFYANVNWDGIFYGLWIVEGGSLTNHGDGGYINWAYYGQWKRHGKTVTFR